jgi:hypothetical protein
MGNNLPAEIFCNPSDVMPVKVGEIIPFCCVFSSAENNFLLKTNPHASHF